MNKKRWKKMDEYICEYIKSTSNTEILIDVMAFLFAYEEILICMAVKSHLECKLVVALKHILFIFFYFGQYIYIASHKFVFDEIC